MLMKKIIKIAAVMLLCLCLSGCSLFGQEEVKLASNSSSEQSTVENTENTEPTQAPTDAQTEPPAAEAELSFYAVSKDAADYLGESKQEYDRFVDTILAYGSSFTFSTSEVKQKVLEVISQFPLSSLCKSFDSSGETAETTIEYKDDQGEFQKKLKKFEESAKALLSKAGTVETPVEKAIALYGDISDFSYDSNIEYDLCSFFTEKKGSSFSFAGGLSYLLTQAGVENMLATSTTASGEAHRFVIAKLNDSYYAMDPSYENGATGGKGLGYFALSDQAIEKAGTALPYSTGENGYFKGGQALCTDQQFDAAFDGVESWQLDSATHVLYLTRNGVVSSAVKTDEFGVIL